MHDCCLDPSPLFTYLEIKTNWQEQEAEKKREEEKDAVEEERFRFQVFFEVIFAGNPLNSIFPLILVTETILSDDDVPWEILKRRGHESVRLMELTRCENNYTSRSRIFLICRIFPALDDVSIRHFAVSRSEKKTIPFLNSKNRT